MSQTFRAAIITPEAVALDTDVTQVQFPAHDGQVGILKHRAPLLAKLGTGVLRLDTTGGEQRYLVAGGYAEMKADKLTILTSEAVPAANITAQTISAEEQKLAGITGTDAAAIEKRQKQQARVQAMRMLVS